MKKLNKKQLKIILISFILLLILLLVIYIMNFRDFSNISLGTNDKGVFTNKDLAIGDIKYLDNEKQVEKILGKTKKDKEFTANNYSYKIKNYNGLKVTLKEDYDDYVVVKIELTNKKYKTGRNLKVGSRITTVMKKYRIDNKKGNYLYGKYTLENLKTKTIKDSIYIGYREEGKVTYYSRDELDSTDDISMLSKIEYKYNGFGKVTKITWSYDRE